MAVMRILIPTCAIALFFVAYDSDRVIRPDSITRSESYATKTGEPAEEKPLWHADWATAQRIAKKTNKPIFAVMVCKH